MTRATTRDRWAWLALALLGFALRAWGLAAQCLWSDEDITLDRARLAWGELLADLPVEHPPAYFLLVRAWTGLAGDGDFALRFPSLAAGVVAVVLGGHVATRLVGRRAGLITGLVLAVNPFLVWYGQEARMYTLLAALALAALACVLRAESARRPAVWWLAAGVFAALTVYTHYYGVLLVLVLVSWGLLDVARHGRAALRGWLIAGGTAAVLFLPWLPRAVGVLGFPGWREPQMLAAIPVVVATDWSAGWTGFWGWTEIATALYVGLALLGLVALARTTLRSRAVGAARALLFLLVPLVAMAVVVWKTQDFHPRYYFAALPGFYLAVAAGAAALPRRLPTLAAALLALAALSSLWGLYSGAVGQKQDYRAFLRAVETAAGHEDTVLFLDGPSLGLARRYEMADSPVKIVNVREGQDEPPAERVVARAEELAAEYPHLWLAENGEANGVVGRWLEEHAFPVEERWFQDVRLHRYYVAPRAASSEPAAADVPDPARRFSDGPAIVGLPGAVRAGGVLPVTLAWPGSGERPRAWYESASYTTSIRLAPAGDPAHAVVATDRELRGQTAVPASPGYPTPALIERRGLHVPADTPPGDYQLMVVLYLEIDSGAVGSWLGPTVIVEAPP